MYFAIFAGEDFAHFLEITFKEHLKMAVSFLD